MCLQADPRRVAYWQDRLAVHAGKLKVGLVWAGRPTHGNDWRRSLPFAQLAALGARPGVVFVSLQLGERARDADAAPGGMYVMSAAAELKDFADTAALLSVLDVLISVDSAPVHVAGALGRPAWTLLPFMPDWRWRCDTDVSSWYPSVRLYRQKRAGDWDGVLRRVAGDVERLVAAKR